jgi:hypothetical protein
MRPDQQPNWKPSNSDRFGSVAAGEIGYLSVGDGSVFIQAWSKELDVYRK